MVIIKVWLLHSNYKLLYLERLAGNEPLSRWSVVKNLLVSLLPGVSGAVCEPAQPADPAGALQLPGGEVLLRNPVGEPTHMLVDRCTLYILLL